MYFVETLGLKLNLDDLLYLFNVCYYLPNIQFAISHQSQPALLKHTPSDPKKAGTIILLGLISATASPDTFKLFTFLNGPWKLVENKLVISKVNSQAIEVIWNLSDHAWWKLQIHSFPPTCLFPYQSLPQIIMGHDS